LTVTVYSAAVAVVVVAAGIVVVVVVVTDAAVAVDEDATTDELGESGEQPTTAANSANHERIGLDAERVV
jgi:hypothetical protein